MPRGRRMMRDGRNPYGAKGGYIRDRGDYAGRNSDYARSQRGGRRSDYGYSNIEHSRRYSGYQPDRRGSMGSRDMMDGHYSRGGREYMPVEAMGVFNGYYGMDRAQDDYGEDYNDDYEDDYAYDMGDYGETLTEDEIKEWKKKLLNEVEEKDKKFFSKETIKQKAKGLNVNFKEYTEDEFLLTALMMYTDYSISLRRVVGENMDIYLRLAKDWLEDDDVAVRGSEKLCVYYDCIVNG